MRQLNCWGRGPAAARVNGQKQLTADKLTAKIHTHSQNEKEGEREVERGGHKMQKENNVTAENCQFVGPYRLEKTLGKGQTGKL